MTQKSLAYAIYRCLTTGIYHTVPPAFRLFQPLHKISIPGMSQRMGDYQDRLPLPQKKHPVIWMHAASVGEVNSAAAIIEQLLALLPGCRMIFSTTTMHGQAQAVRRFDDRVHCLYAPLDFIVSVRKALDRYKPDILVCIETEIWPNWLYEAQAMGIKTAMVNGRMSSRSIRQYVKIKSLFRSILKQVDAFSMIGDVDAERIRMLGAPAERIQVHGNAKYDRPVRTSLADLRQKAHSIFRYDGQDNILVAGSTHSQEEEIILEAYAGICRRFPDTVLIIAPRHIERTSAIEKLLHQKGVEYQLRTKIVHEGPMPRVIILNTIGELQIAYSIATIAFCGGSLVPLGGHNVLEAAAMGVPVLYGPYMDDFSDAQELLEMQGGGAVVHNANDMMKKSIALFEDPQKASEMGQRAAQAVAANQDASRNHALVIKNLLDRP